MAQTLEHNKAVTTVVPVSIPTFDDDLAIIQKLDDEPNDVGGLTAMELKAKFDEGNVTAQQYINNVLIPAVVADDLTEQTRAAAEAERVANEIERVASETNRLSAENARVTNEANRVIAEAAREQAEQARVNSTTGIVAQTTAKANEATAAASAAARDASIARTSAESAQSASNAAQAASTSASSSASTATTAANRASASESSAASSAETAKRYAEQAASAGSGDMLQSVYDPTHKRQDIFKYANTEISEHNSSTSAHADIRTALDGKAPAGYGLGGGGANCTDCNDATANGWYSCGGAENTPGMSYGWMLVSSRSGVGGMIRQDYYTAHSTPLHYARYCVNGTWMDWAQADGAKIATGSYTGAGKFGASNQNSLTFDFEPKVVIVTCASSGDGALAPTDSYWSQSFIWVYGCAKVPVSAGSANFMAFTQNGNSLSWYTTATSGSGLATAQLNNSGWIYNYIAIG